MLLPKNKTYRDPANYKKYRMEHHICERCFAPAVDVHHIIFKGMSGAKVDDRDSNLIALCRYCHDKAHSKDSREMRIELQLIKKGKDANRSKF